jgi:hypothetical protein
VGLRRLEYQGRGYSAYQLSCPCDFSESANVFETGELKEEATISKMETIQQEGNRMDYLIRRIICPVPVILSTTLFLQQSVMG